MAYQEDTLNKLEEMLNKRYEHDFDDEDIAALRRVVNLVRGFDALGSMAGFVSKTFVWMGIVIGGFISFKLGLTDFLLSIIPRG
jgi:hypothetical protein